MNITWFGILFNASLVIQIVANVTVMFCVLPAYKSTKHRAFLFLFFGYLIGTFDTVCDHTIGLSHMPYVQYVAYHTLRRFAYFADVFLGTVGLILLSRSYLRLLPPKLPVEASKTPSQLSSIEQSAKPIAQNVNTDIYRLMENAKVYSKPSYWSSVVTVLKAGDEIAVKESIQNENETWEVLRLPDGTAGYMSAKIRAGHWTWQHDALGRLCQAIQ